MLGTEEENLFDTEPEVFVQGWNPLDFLWDEPQDNLLDMSTKEVEVLTDDAKSFCISNSFDITEHSDMVGREVGDDKVAISLSAYSLSLDLKIREKVMKMIISYDDTFISTEMFDYCSAQSPIPSKKEDSFDFARKNNGTENLGYIDILPLRMLLSSEQSRNDFSTSTVGKASHFSRWKSVSKHVRGTYIAGSIIQDAILRTDKMNEPKYLPRVMGGSGVTPLFNSAENLTSYVRCYKNGTYDRCYGTASNEAIYSKQQSELSKPRSIVPAFCSLLRQKQEYLHLTYGHSVFVPGKEVIQSTQFPAEPIIGQHGFDSSLSSIENRLISCKLITPESDVLVELDKTKRFNELLLRYDLGFKTVLASQKRDREGLKAENDGCVRANAHMCRILDRSANDDDYLAMLNDRNFFHLARGATHFELYHAKLLLSHDIFSWYNYPSSQRLFVTDEVSMNIRMRIPGIPLTPMCTPFKEKETEARVGLWQISQSMLEWAEGKLNSLKAIRDEEGSPTINPLFLNDWSTNDLEWVNDDDGIIKSTITTDAPGPVCIVTADSKLCRRAACSSNRDIYMIQPDSVIGLEKDQILKQFKSTHPHIIVAGVMFDRGAIDAQLSNTDVHDNHVYRRTFEYKDVFEGRRTIHYYLEEIDKGLKAQRFRPFGNKPRR